MEIPSYTITNLIVDYLIKYEVSLNKIRSIPLPFQYQSELDTRLQTEDIMNLSELIGSPIGYDQAEKVQLGKVLPSTKKRLIHLTNYRSAMEFARSYNRETFIPPSTELISHVNVLLTQKLFEEWDSGKIRSFSEIPNDTYDNWSTLRDYYPDLNMARYFDDISSFFIKKQDSTHLLIKIAILLFNFIDKAPFIGGNQTTALVYLSILTKEFGYNPNCNISYSKAINLISEDIKGAFKVSKGNRDLTVFMEVFLYAISLEIRNVENQYIDIFENKVKQHGKLSTKFNSRQLKALDYLKNVDKINRNEYRKMMGISFMTAYRDLQHLVDENYLQIHGVGRATFYSLVVQDSEADQKPDLEVFGDFN